MNFNNTEGRFQSIAICSKNNMDITSFTKFCGASCITFVKFTFDSKIMKLLVLCRKNSSPLTNFCNWLQEFTFYNPVDIIILGNFNIYALLEVAYILRLQAHFSL